MALATTPTPQELKRVVRECDPLSVAKIEAFNEIANGCDAHP